MNEDTQDTTSQSEIPTPLSAGKLMREQREARALSVEEVAHALKLQPRQVVAMETGDFASLGSPPFARGFVRNYARFIGFDATPVLAGLDQQPPLPQHELGEGGGDGPRVAMPEPGRRRPLTWILAVSPLILVAAVGAGLYVFGLNLDALHFGSHASPEATKPAAETVAPSLQVIQPAASKPEAPVPAAPSQALPSAAPPGAVQPSPSSAMPAPAMPAPPASPAPAAKPPSAAATTAAPSVTPAAVPAATPAAPAVSTPAAASVHHVVLSVESESWVEVKSEGHVLLSQKFAAGQSRSLEGKGPFTVVIGNAKGAHVQYDEKPVDLAPYVKVNVARVTLN